MDTHSWKLYYKQNNTINDLNNRIVALSSSRKIFDIIPGAKNIRISNIVLRHTYETHMDSWEVPSGGDWSITRQGAITLEGTENIMIDGNKFYQMGGNGVMVNKYNLNANIIGNYFKYLAQSCIIAVGDTRYDKPDPWNHVEEVHPDGTIVQGNVCSEVGYYVTQSNGFFQALGKNSKVFGNAIFNGPRSGINYNDGFGGNDYVRKNLMFNLVRHSDE